LSAFDLNNLDMAFLIIDFVCINFLAATQKNYLRFQYPIMGNILVIESIGR